MQKNRITIIFTVVVFTIVYQSAQCMSDETRNNVLQMFQKNYSTILKPSNKWELKGDYYTYIEEKNYEELEHNKDLATATNIMDRLPDSQYEKLVQKYASSSALSTKITISVAIIKNKYPELKDYINSMAFKHRCFVTEFAQKIDATTLQQIFEFCKKQNAVPYHVELHPDLIARWYVPQQTNPRTFFHEFKKLNNVENIYPKYPFQPNIGNYIELDCKDNSWQFTFNNKIVSRVFVPYDYRKIKINKIIIDYDPTDELIKSKSEKIEEQ